MPAEDHPNHAIRFFNRYSGRIETEAVFGEKWLRWAYGNPLGRLAVAAAFSRHAFSRWYGARMNRPASRLHIPPFIRRYALDPNEFAEPVESFASFNDFFRRKLKPGARPVDPHPLRAVFPADGRHLAIPDIAAARTFHVKGRSFDLAAFLDDPHAARQFQRGAMLLSRLCPVDYHRFHFPVGGRAGPPRPLRGPLRSVNPLALRRSLSILWENRRVITHLHSPDFGPVLLVEIGATCVGRIRQTYAPGPVLKGDEKGFFEFGGSCLATIFAPGAIRFDQDLLRHSAQAREVYARMGDRCGTAHSA